MMGCGCSAAGRTKLVVGGSAVYRCMALDGTMVICRGIAMGRGIAVDESTSNQLHGSMKPGDGVHQCELKKAHLPADRIVVVNFTFPLQNNIWSRVNN